MKWTIGLVATAVAALGTVAPANAQMPAPRYVKRAVYVRIHWDRSFFEYWNNKGTSTAQMNTMLRGYFDAARADYLNNASLHNIDLFLLEDFDRATGPMSSYRDSAPQVGGDVRLIDAMRARLQTGNVNKTTPNGTTHLLGRTVNWVFVHGNFGGLGGKADSIRGLSTADANVFISTGTGDLTAGGRYFPLVEQRADIIQETLEHETGHLFGGEHGGRNELADCPGPGRYELMCSGFTPVQRRFGSANFQRVTNVMKGTLGRCNSAFTSANSCANAVSTECSKILDYTQIQPCIDSMVASTCQDICTTTQKTARVVVNSLPTYIGSGVVVAAGPAQ